jgi:chemotaxis response regulator CheB
MQSTFVSTHKDFPAVCVGGSAGGLDAYIWLPKPLPLDLGFAIAMVNHITRCPKQLNNVRLAAARAWTVGIHTVPGPRVEKKKSEFQVRRG